MAAAVRVGTVRLSQRVDEIGEQRKLTRAERMTVLAAHRSLGDMHSISEEHRLEADALNKG